MRLGAAARGMGVKNRDGNRHAPIGDRHGVGAANHAANQTVFIAPNSRPKTVIGGNREVGEASNVRDQRDVHFGGNVCKGESKPGKILPVGGVHRFLHTIPCNNSIGQRLVRVLVVRHITRRGRHRTGRERGGGSAATMQAFVGAAIDVVRVECHSDVRHELAVVTLWRKLKGTCQRLRWTCCGTLKLGTGKYIVATPPIDGPKNPADDILDRLWVGHR